jgi:DNA-binding MarR family transcriptional regulator
MAEPHYRAASYQAADSVGYLIRRLYSIMLTQLEAAFAGHGFTLMQWIVLIYLRDGLAQTASDIAREFQHDSGALTRLIDQLERRGLLTRRRGKSDRRVVRLALTAKGRRTIESLLPVVVEQMNRALAPLSHEEFEQFRSTLARLVDHLQATESPSLSVDVAPRPASRSVAKSVSAKADRSKSMKAKPVSRGRRA